MRGRDAVWLRMTGDGGIFGGVPRKTPRQRVGWGSMRIEIYRVVYWVGMTALVVWTVYSAYSAIRLS